MCCGVTHYIYTVLLIVVQADNSTSVPSVTEAVTSSYGLTNLRPLPLMITGPIHHPHVIHTPHTTHNRHVIHREATQMHEVATQSLATVVWMPYRKLFRKTVLTKASSSTLALSRGTNSVATLSGAKERVRALGGVAGEVGSSGGLGVERRRLGHAVCADNQDTLNDLVLDKKNLYRLCLKIHY